MANDNNKPGGGGGTSIRDALVTASLAAGGYYSVRNIAAEMPNNAPLAGHTATMLEEIAPIIDAEPSTAKRTSDFISFSEALSSNRITTDMWGSRVKAGMHPNDIRFAWERAASTLPESVRPALSPSELGRTAASSMPEIFKTQLPRLGVTARESFISTFRDTVHAINTQRSVYGSDYDISLLAPATRGKSSLIYESVGVSQLPKGFQPYVKRIGERLGYTPSLTWVTLPEWQKEGLGKYVMNLPMGGELNIPTSVRGTVLGGQNLTSRWIAGKWGVVSGGKITERLTAGQYLLSRFEKDIIPRLNPNTAGAITTGGELRATIGDLENYLRQQMEYIPAAPPGTEDTVLTGYANLRGQSLHLVNEAGQIIPATEAIRMKGIKDLIGTELTGGGISPTGLVDQGKLSTYDVRKLFTGGMAASEARSPRQAFRNIGFVSNRPDAKFRWLMSDEYWRNFGDSALELQNVRFFKSTPVNYRGGSGEWEIIDRMWEQTAKHRTKTVQLSNFTSDIAEQFKALGNVHVPKGAAWGYDRLGDIITAEYPMDIIRTTEHGTMTNAIIREFIEPEKSTKVFGLKATLLDRPAQMMGGYEARIPISDLLKEQHYLNMQITSSLWDTAMRKVRQAKLSPERQAMIQGFLSNPGQVVESIAQSAAKSGAFDEAYFVKQMMAIGTVVDLNPTQFGTIFGAVPEFFGSGWTEKTGASELGYSIKHLFKAHQMDPTGSIYVFAGDPSYAGQRASIEPRMFTALRTGPYGQLGEDVANELATRAMEAGPEQLRASKEVLRSLQSMVGDIAPNPNAAMFKLQETFDERAFRTFSEAGGLLEMPGSLPSVYMPGQAEMKLMMPFMTAEGKPAYSEVAKIYSGLARNASIAVGEGDTAMAEFASMEAIRREGSRRGYYQFAADLQKTHALFGKSTLGLLRGKAQRPYGSRFLTISSAMGSEEGMKKFLANAGPMTAGISDVYFNQMTKELSEARVSPEEIESLSKRFLGGEKIGAAAWRHPAIGPYSTNMINIMRIEGAGADPLVVLKEMDGINISPLMAMAADKDGDTAGIMMLHGKLERQALTASENISIPFIEHAARVKYLKPTAQASKDLLLAKDLSRVAIEKLGMPQGYVPKISLAVSQAKQAIARFSDNPLYSKAWSALEMLEQVPIGGKHIPEKELIQNINAFQIKTEGLLSALSTGDPLGIETQTRALFKDAIKNDTKIAQMLEEGITVSSSELNKIRAINPSFTGKVAGLQIEETAKFIGESIQQFNASDASLNYKLLSGKVSASSPGMIRKYINLATDALGMTKKEGIGKVIAGIRTAIDNATSAGGKKLFRALKPLGLGALVAGGVGMALSPSLDPGPPSPEVLANRQPRVMAPESIYPPDHTMGSVSNPGTFPNSARIMGQKAYNIIGNFTGDGVDTASLTQQIQSSVNNVGRVNVNINDRSNPADRHTLLNSMF